MEPTIRVLIVDDSVVLRRYLSDLIGRQPGMAVAAVASSGRLALARVSHSCPDLVLLDVEMPDLDGLSTLRELRKTHPRLPVIMCSSLTHKGAAATLDALTLGANDYIAKPTAGQQGAREEFDQLLLAKIRALRPASPHLARAAVRPPPAAARPPLPRTGAAPPVEIVALGVSTGGPNALAQLLPELPADFPVPIVIVQHMPPLFTKLLADRLGRLSSIAVHEAEQGMPLCAGAAYVAPGDFHMEVAVRGTGAEVVLHQGPPESSCRPAVDVLLRSVAAQYGAASLAAILTGMGQDGLRGCEQVRLAGGQVLVQDQESSVVWGMPGFVATAGYAEEILPLSHMALALLRRVWRGRGGPRTPVTGTKLP